MRRLMVAIPALLIMSASGCSSRPERLVVQHPPAKDLFCTKLPDGTVECPCPDEPDIVTEMQADPSGLTFDVKTRAAGQKCRDSFGRLRQWHQDQGAKVPAGMIVRDQSHE